MQERPLGRFKRPCSAFLPRKGRVIAPSRSAKDRRGDRMTFEKVYVLEAALNLTSFFRAAIMAIWKRVLICHLDEIRASVCADA